MEISNENIFTIITVVSTVITTLSTLITAVIAIIALIQSGKQINLSNKQHLFDKRIENYIIAKGMLELYRENQLSIEEEKKDEPYFIASSMFTWLTNNSYLEFITPVINNPLENPKHKEFLSKMEELKNVSTKNKFLFSIEISRRMEKFIINYQKLLSALYKYQITLNCMNDVLEKYKKTLEEASKNVREEEHRNNLYKDFENLKIAYKEIEEYKVEEKIEKQINLL